MDKPSLKQKVFGTRKAPSLGSKIVMGVFITAVALVSIAVVTAMFVNRDNNKVDEGTLQAVFLENGQVYFGSLSDVNSDYVKLTNIYYLQSNADVQKQGSDTAESQQKVQLNKLGGELHGPQDEMFIVRENISFWENLKQDSKVIQAIKSKTTQTNTNQQTSDSSTDPANNANAAN
jgi:hypothetical protein